LTDLFSLLTGASICFFACRFIGWGAIFPLAYFGLAFGIARLAGETGSPKGPA
jgi:hypothetical protein